MRLGAGSRFSTHARGREKWICNGMCACPQTTVLTSVRDDVFKILDVHSASHWYFSGIACVSSYRL